MLTLTGRVINIYKKPNSMNQKTGEVFESKSKVQILGETPLQGGDVQMDTHDLSCTDVDLLKKFAALKGKIARVHVAQWHADKGGDGGLYIVKGTQPEEVKA